MTEPRDAEISADELTRAKAVVIEKFTRRRRRRVARRAAVGIVAAVAAVGAVVGLELPSHTPTKTTLAVQSPSTTSPSSGATVEVSGSIHLDTSTVAAGQPISGHLLVDNPTGATVTIGHGCPGFEFAVVLEGHGVVPDPGWGASACVVPFRVPAGISTYPITVSTSYGFCGGTASEATKQIPTCKGPGLPPLPAAKYQATLITQGISIHNVATVPVMLTPAKKSQKPSATTATKEITGSIDLAATSVKAGQPISGHLLIQSPDLTADKIGPGCPGARFAVVLEGHGVVPSPVWSLVLCTYKLPSGLSSYPITVRTTYGSCVATVAHATKQVPYCKASVVSPLPAGRYQATVVTGGGIAIHNVATVPVTLSLASN